MQPASFDIELLLVARLLALGADFWTHRNRNLRRFRSRRLIASKPKPASALSETTLAKSDPVSRRRTFVIISRPACNYSAVMSEATRLGLAGDLRESRVCVEIQRAIKFTRTPSFKPNLSA